MDLRNRISSHYQNGQEIYLRNISIDCVIFGFHKNELKVLLLHTLYSNLWALPGGFILKEEHMDDAANRILLDRTGLDNIYLQQFHVFSKPERSTKEINQKFLKNLGLELEESWMFERFVTVGYNALVDFNKVKKLESDIFSSKCEWFNIDALPDMHLDHQEIINKALEKMQLDLNYHPIGYNLLPEKFTMPELQKLYETVLNKKLDRRNFQRKIIGEKILKRLEETKKGVAHKAPSYYKFDLKNYQTALKVGLGFDL